MKNTAIPNYIYRWNRRTLEQTVFSAAPQYQWQVLAFPYWDCFVDEYELSLRPANLRRLATLCGGPTKFLRLMTLVRAAMNSNVVSRSQGNKFLGLVVKGEHQPWIPGRGTGRYRRDTLRSLIVARRFLEKGSVPCPPLPTVVDL